MSDVQTWENLTPRGRGPTRPSETVARNARMSSTRLVRKSRSPLQSKPRRIVLARNRVANEISYPTTLGTTSAVMLKTAGRKGECTDSVFFL